MAKLIEASVLVEWLKYVGRFFKGTANHKMMTKNIGKIIDHIEAMPAVEVVRCKDCKYYEIHRPKVLENCERSGHLVPMKPDDFCSYGERGEGA